MASLAFNIKWCLVLSVQHWSTQKDSGNLYQTVLLKEEQQLSVTDGHLSLVACVNTFAKYIWVGLGFLWCHQNTNMAWLHSLWAFTFFSRCHGECGHSQWRGSKALLGTATALILIWHLFSTAAKLTAEYLLKLSSSSLDEESPKMNWDLDLVMMGERLKEKEIRLLRLRCPTAGRAGRREPHGWIIFKKGNYDNLMTVRITMTSSFVMLTPDANLQFSCGNKNCSLYLLF